MGELLRGHRVLIVEDNFVMALDLSLMVEDLGGRWLALQDGSTRAWPSRKRTSSTPRFWT